MARITVVNDQREFLEVMDEILTTAGHDVTPLKGDGVGVDDLARTRPELLVIDLRLDSNEGRLTGWDLLVLARADDRLQQIPIVLCSADHAGAKVHAEELQALTDVHLLLKPFSIAEVDDLVTHLLGRIPFPPLGEQRPTRDLGVAAPDGG